MKQTATSIEEQTRMQSLLDFQILDTLPEAEYDDVTFLASFICETPVALISLSDGTRQWFKSKVGLGATEIPREGSFCDHAIRGEGLFLVPDALNDPRFVHHALVAGAPYFRFYAGVPIVAANGQVAGTVCVLDKRPRRLSEKQLQSLVTLARQVAAQLEARKVNLAMRSQFEQLQQYARQISKQEERHIYTAKMNSLGEMASGIAHEVNNPLAIILGYNQVLLNLAEKDNLEPEKIKALGKRIDITAQRIAKIVSSLVSFAEDSDQTGFREVSVSELLAQTADFCQSRFHSHDIYFEIPEVSKSLVIQAQSAQLSQVLLNLLNNSYDAIVDTDIRWIRIECQDHGEEISLIVTDSGLGIPKEIRPHLMEPFFTTKSVGKGAGLGLSVARGILQAHGGQLVLDTTSKNTRFVARFPKTQPSVFKAAA